MRTPTLTLAVALALVIYGGWMTYEAWTARWQLHGAYVEYGYCVDLLSGGNAVPVEE